MPYPRPKMISIAVASACAFGAPPVVAQQQTIDTATTTAAPDATPSQSVTVVGIRRSIADAINVKRYSDSISDAISAQDVGKLPDQNVAETISRIPGVQITRVEGEGAKINVRGIGLNRQLLNGMSFVGAQSNGDPNLSDFPSEILSSVEVIKAPTPDLVEGWLGAVVNMKTVRPLELGKPLISGRLQGSYGDKSSKYGSKGSFSYGDKFNDGSLGLLLSVTTSDYNGRSDGFSSRGFSSITGNAARALGATGPGADLPTFYRPNRLEEYVVEYEAKRLGLNSTLQWRPIKELTLTMDALHSRSDVERKRSVNQLIFSNAMSNAHVAADGTIDAATQTAPVVRPIVFNGPTHNIAKALALNADYKLDRWKFNASVSKSSGNGDGGDGGGVGAAAYNGADYVPVMRNAAPTTATVRYAYVGSDVSPDYSLNTNFNATDASQYEAFTVVYQTYLSKNTGKDAQFNAKYALDWGPLNSVKFGVRKEELSVLSQTAGVSFSSAQLAAVDRTPANSLRGNEVPGLHYTGLIANFMDGESGAFPRTLLTGNFDHEVFRSALNGVQTPADIARQQQSINQIKQKTDAFYVRADFDTELLGLPVAGNFGVRHVTSKRTSSGFTLLNATSAAPVIDQSKFQETLPSFNANVELRQDLNLRVSAAKVTARPPLTLTGVGLTVQPSTGTGNAGNPDLKPFAATQYDLSGEWYFAKASMLSLGLFKKNVSAFTTSVTVKENHPEIVAPGISNTEYLITRPVNGTDGTVHGFELNYYHALSFLPEPFDGLGYNLSWTRAISKTPNVDELTGKTLPLPFSSENSYNVIAYYEKGNVSARIAYNYRSKYLDSQQSASLGGSLWQAGRGQVDASISYRLSDRYRLTFDAINLNKAVRSLYTGTELRTTASWQDDRRFYHGLAGTI